VVFLPFCIKCGFEVPEEATFCPSCEAPVTPKIAAPVKPKAMSKRSSRPNGLRARELFIMTLGGAIIGGGISGIIGIFAEMIMLGIIGGVIGGVMGGCLAAKTAGLGSYMTDELWIGPLVYRYRDRIVEHNWFGYAVYFLSFALFVIYLWAFSPRMPFTSASFLSDILHLALAGGGAFAIHYLVNKLSDWVGST